MTYVGFGTWIGPRPCSLQLSSPIDLLTSREIPAFTEASSNLALNVDSAWAGRAFVQPACVATDGMAESQEMASAVAGDSCSGLDKNHGCFRGGRAPVRWQVRYYPLPYLFTEWGIATDATNNLHSLAIPAESLLPGWVDMLEPCFPPANCDQR